MQLATVSLFDLKGAGGGVRPSREGAGGRGCLGAARLGVFRWQCHRGTCKFEQDVYVVEFSICDSKLGGNLAFVKV